MYILKASLNAVIFNAFAKRLFLAYDTLHTCTYIYNKNIMQIRRLTDYNNIVCAINAVWAMRSSF